MNCKSHDVIRKRAGSDVVFFDWILFLWFLSVLQIILVNVFDGK